MTLSQLTLVARFVAIWALGVLGPPAAIVLTYYQYKWTAVVFAWAAGLAGYHTYALYKRFGLLDP